MELLQNRFWVPSFISSCRNCGPIIASEDKEIRGYPGQGMEENCIEKGPRVKGDESEDESSAERRENLGRRMAEMVESRDNRLHGERRNQADGRDQGEKNEAPVEEFPGGIVQENVGRLEGEEGSAAPAGRLGKRVEPAELGVPGADETGEDRKRGANSGD